MADVFSDEDLKDYTEAVLIFDQGKTLVDKGKFSEGMDLLRKSLNTIGMERARRLSSNSFMPGSDGYLVEYYELMGRGYYGLKDYEKALESFKQWIEEVTARFGPNSMKLAICHQWLARAWSHIDVYEGHIDADRIMDIKSFFYYMRTLFNVSARYQKNMEMPIQHYQMAYHLLETQDGSTTDKSELKSEIVGFFCENVCVIQIIISIYQSFLLIPLSLIIIVYCGIIWHSLWLILELLAAFVLWRIVNIGFFFWMTYKHHTKNVI